MAAVHDDKMTIGSRLLRKCLEDNGMSSAC